MARIPDDVIDQIKTDTSLVRLVEHVGIELKKQGKDLAGKCPFHEDDTPSLIISESKNVFHCFGCDASRKGSNLKKRVKSSFIRFRRKGSNLVLLGLVDKARALRGPLFVVLFGFD